MDVGLKCNCSAIPPTMPTCRTEHLADCPRRMWDRLHSEQGRADFEEARALINAGDTDGLVAFAQRGSADRAQAAILRREARFANARQPKGGSE